MRRLYFLIALSACAGTDPATSAEHASCSDPQRGPEVAWFGPATSLGFSYASRDYRGGGLAVSDLDGDGLPDIIAGSRMGGLMVFHNDGHLAFSQLSVGLDPTWEVDAILAADLDNDGDNDLVIATRDSAHVMENVGGGTFRSAAELTGTGATEHVLATDLDGDGQLDLYFGNRDPDDVAASTNRLYLNRGQLAFAATPPVGAGLTWTTTAFDIDGDGDQDLYVANDTLIPDFGGPERPTYFPSDLLLRNDGLDGSGVPVFTDIATSLGLDQPHSSMGSVVGDFDEDGRLDLFVTNLGAKKLYLQSDSGFVESAAAFGVQAISRLNTTCVVGTEHEGCLFLSWAAAAADFDLDGHDELLVTNGDEQDAHPPLLLFSRASEPEFHELAPDLPCLGAQALIATDLDGDGDPDLVIAQTNGPLLVSETRGTPSSSSWLRVELRGRSSNRAGIGATVTLHMASGRTQVRIVGAGGVIHSSAPPEALFGLGADTATELDVRWPSGRTTTLTHPPSGRLLVDEGS